MTGHDMTCHVMSFESSSKKECQRKNLQTDRSNRLEMAAISLLLIFMQIRMAAALAAARRA
jgi:hypothetical protein